MQYLTEKPPNYNKKTTSENVPMLEDLSHRVTFDTGDSFQKF